MQKKCPLLNFPPFYYPITSGSQCKTNLSWLNFPTKSHLQNMFTIGFLSLRASLWWLALGACKTAYAPRRDTKREKVAREHSWNVLSLLFFPRNSCSSHRTMDTTTAVSCFTPKLFTDSQDSIMVRKGEGLVWSFSSPGLGPKKVVEKFSNSSSVQSVENKLKSPMDLVRVHCYSSACGRCCVCFVLDPVSVHGPKPKHTKHLPQADE